MTDQTPPEAPKKPSQTALAAWHVKQVSAAWQVAPPPEEVYRLLRVLSRWRSYVLAQTYLKHHGPVIQGGPFAGMTYVEEATEGALIPRLLGTYESELHPHIDEIAAAGLDCVIDVGCAEGYYAVGLARRYAEVTVHAHDIDEKARHACAELASRNGVSERVVVGGEFRPEHFQAFGGRRVLVLVDAEGAEVDVLKPDLAPALGGMSIIVETHDIFRPGAMATLFQRFAATHDILRVDQQPKAFDMPAWMRALPHLDQLLAVWEWRAGPTPWLVMRPRAG